MYHKVPIKNVFNMFCYVWDRLDLINEINVSCSYDLDQIPLISKVFIYQTSILVKRGLYKQYRLNTETINGIKGRINFEDSINNLSFKTGKINCSFDEFSSDVLINQLIKATLIKLILLRNLNFYLKKQCKDLLTYFDEIELKEFNYFDFDKVHYNRNNQHYYFVVKLAQLIYCNLSVSEDSGKFNFYSFLDDEKQMNNIFELFIYKFCKMHLSSKTVEHSKQMRWQAIGGNMSLLPIMEMDICLSDSEKMLIIDTKYYKDIFNTRYDSNKFKSENLYQIYTYINQNTFEGEISGMLLYPSNGYEILETYEIDGKKITIVTIDLNKDWNMIENKLIELVN